MGRTVSDITGGSSAARGAGRAALDRESMAKGYQDFTNNAAANLNRLADASPQELMAYEKSIAAQEKNVARTQDLLSNLDPALIEASQQALKLLRGESASALAPAMQQRQTQREKLLNQLRSQLGPGAETSSIGRAALQRFDSETNQLTSQMQQQALGNLSGFLGQQSGVRSSLGNENARLAALGQVRGGLNERKLGAARSGYDLQNSGWNARMGNAGAQYAHDVYQGQASQQGFGTLMQLGAMVGGVAGIGGALGSIGSGLGSIGSGLGSLFGSSGIPGGGGGIGGAVGQSQGMQLNPLAGR